MRSTSSTRAARSWCASSTSTRVPDRVRSLLADPPRLRQMGEAMLRAAKPDAADVIAEELIALAAS